jgi:hypothetical protein
MSDFSANWHALIKIGKTYAKNLKNSLSDLEGTQYQRVFRFVGRKVEGKTTDIITGIVEVEGFPDGRIVKNPHTGVPERHRN